MEVDNNIEMGYFNEDNRNCPISARKLKNTHIRFEVKIAERHQTRKLYLPEEKFRYMAEKNLIWYTCVRKSRRTSIMRRVLLIALVLFSFMHSPT